MDNELDEIFDKVAEFSEIFKESIQDKSCMDANPFIDNLSKYIGNYIPQFESVFKYHLFFETILSILSSTGSPTKSLLESFNEKYTEKPSTSRSGVFTKPQPLTTMEDIRQVGAELVIKNLTRIVDSPENTNMTMFNATSSGSSTNSVSPDIQTALLQSIVNILENTSRYNTEPELAAMYEGCFPEKTENGQQGGGPTDPFNPSNTIGKSLTAMNTISNAIPGNPISTFTDAAKTPMNAISNVIGENKNQTTDLPSDTPGKKTDPDKTCFINTKRDNKLKKTLMTNNVTKLNIKQQVGRMITDEIDKLSQLVLSEKSFNRALLKSKNPEDVSKIKMIKTAKNNLIHNYVFMIKKDDKEYGDLYEKSFTIQILQNIKLYLINIAKSIVTKSKDHSVYALNALLLTLLQDNGIKGFILTIGRTKQYYIYAKNFKYYKRVNNQQKIELNAIACLTYIYHNIAVNPKIKIADRIDLKRTYNYIKQLNSGLSQQLFKGGVNPMSMTDMSSAMTGLSNMTNPEILNQTVKQPVSSYLDPQNRYVETVIKDYVGSVISSVKKKVYTYDVYKYVKPRLAVDADDLRTALLVCALELFNGKSFHMFLTKLLQDNDILQQPAGNSSPPTSAVDDNKLVGNDIIFHLFLQKLTDDLNKPANKFSVEVIGKYTNLISGIGTPKNTENEIAKALRENVKKPRGGRKWEYRASTIKHKHKTLNTKYKTVHTTPKQHRDIARTPK